MNQIIRNLHHVKMKVTYNFHRLTMQVKLLIKTELIKKSSSNWWFILKY